MFGRRLWCYKWCGGKQSQLPCKENIRIEKYFLKIIESALKKMGDYYHITVFLDVYTLGSVTNPFI